MGLEGIGLYWCIIEFLYENNGYLTMDEDIEMLVYELRTDKEKILKLINNYDLFKISKNQFFSQSVLNRLREIENLSKTNREKALKRWGNKKETQHTNGNAKNMQKQCKSNATASVRQCNIKEKKIKENKNKIKEIIITTTSNNIEEKFARPLSSTEYEKIKTWLETYNQELILYATDIAILNQVKTFSYIEGILKTWNGKNLKTLEEVKLEEKRFDKLKYSEKTDEELKQFEELFEDYNWLEDSENEKKEGRI